MYAEYVHGAQTWAARLGRRPDHMERAFFIAGPTSAGPGARRPAKRQTDWEPARNPLLDSFGHAPPAELPTPARRRLIPYRGSFVKWVAAGVVFAWLWSGRCCVCVLDVLGLLAEDRGGEGR